MTMSFPELVAVLSRCRTPLGYFRFGRDGGPVGRPAPFWLQFCAEVKDTTKPTIELMRGRKWRVSAHSTEREIVGTAMAAVLAYVEHEARETFTYEGDAVFGPHIPLYGLRVAAEMEPDRRG